VGLIQDFLAMYSKPNTVKSYRTALLDFFAFVYKLDREKATPDDIEKAAANYFQSGRFYDKDIDSYLSFLSGKPPKTVKLKLNAVKVLLIENKVELPQRFWRRVKRRIPGSRAQTIDKVPNNEELRRILTHLPIHSKAACLVGSSSGMRIGEILQLKISDLELDKKPCLVNVRAEYTKTSNARVTFISSEAQQVIEEWLKVRDEWLQAAVRKSHIYAKKADDSRLFPFEECVVRRTWENALRKSGLLARDASTKRMTIHFHVLRKFFRTRLGAVIPVDIVEALMGHEGYLTAVYRQYDTAQLAEFYEKGEHALDVFSTNGAAVTKLRVEIEEQNKNLQAMVNNLLSENVDLKKRIQGTEQKLGELEKLVKEALKQDSVEATT